MVASAVAIEPSLKAPLSVCKTTGCPPRSGSTNRYRIDSRLQNSPTLRPLRGDDILRRTAHVARESFIHIYTASTYHGIPPVYIPGHTASLYTRAYHQFI